MERNSTKMTRLLRLLAALAVLAGATANWGPATAADLLVKKAVPATASYLPASWAGLYVSGYGLYGANLTNTAVTDMTTVADIASAPHGPGVGGAIGYNFQPVPNGVVFGVRADVAYANLHGSGAVSTVPSMLSVSNATNYLGDIDAIIGLPLTPDGKLLGYTGGGFAFGGAKPNLQVATLAQAASDTSTGWNVLAGLSYQLTPSWQVFMEGDYFQLGDKSLTATFNGQPVATSLTKYHIFEQKLGITYKF